MHDILLLDQYCLYSPALGDSGAFGVPSIRVSHDTFDQDGDV